MVTGQTDIALTEEIEAVICTMERNFTFYSIAHKEIIQL